jgi:endonuclease YncB( thermonuclease family)
VIQKVGVGRVRQGLSPYCTKYGKSEKYDAEFRAVEKQARKEELNIWLDPELTKKIFKA